jgi:hypothetical protein
MAWRRLLLSKQIIQRGFRALDLRRVLGNVGASLGLEEITEIRLVFLADLLGGRLLAMLRVRRVVFDAHLANVDFGVARLAHVQSAKRQAQSGQRGSATPADKGMGQLIPRIYVDW